MAENLAYVTTFTYAFLYPNKAMKSGIYCFGDDIANCEKYGMIYNLEAALKACPVGWHLPTEEEYDTLFLLAGKEKHLVYQSLIEGGSLKFDATLGGYLESDGVFPRFSLGKLGGYWTSGGDKKQINSASYIYINSNFKKAVIVDRAYKLWGFSVRCLKDTTE
jgi:uncharacterized protein (TIGR02145 family)